jgi:hypothetical protein
MRQVHPCAPSTAVRDPARHSRRHAAPSCVQAALRSAGFAATRLHVSPPAAHASAVASRLQRLPAVLAILLLRKHSIVTSCHRKLTPRAHRLDGRPVFVKDISRSCQGEDDIRQEWRLRHGLVLPEHIPLFVQVAPSMDAEECKWVPGCCLLTAAGTVLLRMLLGPMLVLSQHSLGAFTWFVILTPCLRPPQASWQCLDTKQSAAGKTSSAG